MYTISWPLYVLSAVLFWEEFMTTKSFNGTILKFSLGKLPQIIILVQANFIHRVSIIWNVSQFWPWHKFNFLTTQTFQRWYNVLIWILFNFMKIKPDPFLTRLNQIKPKFQISLKSDLFSAVRSFAWNIYVFFKPFKRKVKMWRY